MNILALDTATDCCSCAIQVGGELVERTEVAPQKHAQLLLPMIDGLLVDVGVERSQLDAVVFGRGPGSFTGLRIAAAAAQGIAFALDLPVVGISTLAALAQQNYRLNQHSLTLACIDARMSEVYWAAYEVVDDQVALLGEECVSDPVEVIAPDERGWCLSGSGLAVCRQQPDHALAAVSDAGLSAMLPQARDMLELALPPLRAGEGVSADQALPVYLRNKVALTEAERAVKN